MAGVWNFSVLQLYSLDSSFAIGLARSAVLSQKSSYKIIPRHFGVQNRPLGLKIAILGFKSGFYSLSNRVSAALGLHLRIFNGFGVDLGWILLAPGSEIKLFSW